MSSSAEAVHSPEFRYPRSRRPYQAAASTGPLAMPTVPEETAAAHRDSLDEVELEEHGRGCGLLPP